MSASQAEFEPPRILSVLYSPDEGLMPEIYGERGYFIDKGKDANIKQGDALKVYREFAANRGKRPMLIFIGTWIQLASAIFGLRYVSGFVTPHFIR